MLTRTLAAALLTGSLGVLPAMAAEKISGTKDTAAPSEKCQTMQRQAGGQKIVTGKDVPGSAGSEATTSGSKAASDSKATTSAGKEPVTKTAMETNRDMVKDTKTTADGSVVVATGPAKPTENWFGCPPEKE